MKNLIRILALLFILFAYTGGGKHKDFAQAQTAGEEALNIVTVAGRTFSIGEGGPATNAVLDTPVGVAVDASDNLYIAAILNQRVWKVDQATGIITTFAGTGDPGFNGDGILATEAQLTNPRDVAFDASGNLYIAEAIGHRVRKVDQATGKITTVAGTGTAGFFTVDTNADGIPDAVGDNIPAISARINQPTGLAFDASGNLYIAEAAGNRVRKVDFNKIVTDLATGVFGPEITTFAGGGTLTGAAAENVSATSARLSISQGIGFDALGKNLYIGEGAGHRVRKVFKDENLASPTFGQFIITTFAGTGTAGYVAAQDGGPAILAQLNGPDDVAFDASGSLYIADRGNHRVRKVDFNKIVIGTDPATGLPVSGPEITTVVNKTPGTAGYVAAQDGGPAISAQLNGARKLIFDATKSNLYIGDTTNHRIRKVDMATGNITTVAGGGSLPPLGDDGPATNAVISSPVDVATDASGDLYISDRSNSRVRKVNMATGIITTVVNKNKTPGNAGFSGDGGPATSARINFPNGVDLDASGNLYISDFSNHRIRKVDAATATGIITTVVNKTPGTAGFSGDGGPATSAQISSPVGVAVDALGKNLYIGDRDNNRVRFVNLASSAVTVFSGQVVDPGKITTVAGTGTAAFTGDGGPAIDAQLNDNYGVAVDASGNLYIADRGNHRIRKVDATTGIITTVAGTGTGGFNGDGIAATSAQIKSSIGLEVDASRNLYIGDSGNNRVRKVNAATGIITTVAGTITGGFNGDGIAATSALLSGVRGVAFDASGNIYISDTGNNRARRLNVAVADLKVTPVSLDVASPDEWVTAHITFAAPRVPAEVDVESVKLIAVDALERAPLTEDPPGSGVFGLKQLFRALNSPAPMSGNKLTLKFHRPTVLGWGPVGSTLNLRVEGKFTDGRYFSGDTSITIVSQ